MNIENMELPLFDTSPREARFIEKVIAGKDYHHMAYQRGLYYFDDRERALISDAAQSLCEQVRMPNIEHVADDHNDAVKAIRAVAHKLREQSND